MSPERVNIVAIGNRLVPRDSAGPLVHDLLARRKLPPNYQLIDGGTIGLDLITFLEHVDRVVFIDQVHELQSPQGVVVLSPEDIQEDMQQPYTHASGLSYLFQVLPMISESPLPEIFIVGICEPAGPQACNLAADQALAIAAHGNAAVETYQTTESR